MFLGSKLFTTHSVAYLLPATSIISSTTYTNPSSVKCLKSLNPRSIDTAFKCCSRVIILVCLINTYRILRMNFLDPLEYLLALNPNKLVNTA